MIIFSFPWNNLIPRNWISKDLFILYTLLNYLTLTSISRVVTKAYPNAFVFLDFGYRYNWYFMLTLFKFLHEIFIAYLKSRKIYAFGHEICFYHIPCHQARLYLNTAAAANNNNNNNNQTSGFKIIFSLFWFILKFIFSLFRIPTIPVCVAFT